MPTRRERRAARPLGARIAIVVAGAVLALAALILLIPLPEAGVPLLLLALRLLALEFDWADSAYSWVLARWEQAKRLWRSRPAWLRHSLVALLAALVVLVIWWLVHTL